jgi:hypothetical protein
MIVQSQASVLADIQALAGSPRDLSLFLQVFVP